MKDKIIYFAVGAMLGFQVCYVAFNERIFKPKIVIIKRQSQRHIVKEVTR